jgi:hypothetical protein
MKEAIPTAIALFIYMGLGFFAGHYHGKAEVYAGMMAHYTNLAEVME